MVVPEPIRWIDGFGPNHRSDVALRSSPRRHRATAPRDAGSAGEAAGSPRQECPVELKSTIDRWNKRWPGDRDGRERPAWGGGVDWARAQGRMQQLVVVESCSGSQGRKWKQGYIFCPPFSTTRTTKFRTVRNQ